MQRVAGGRLVLTLSLLLGRATYTHIPAPRAARRAGRPVLCSCSLPANSEMLQVRAFGCAAAAAAACVGVVAGALAALCADRGRRAMPASAMHHAPSLSHRASERLRNAWACLVCRAWLCACTQVIAERRLCEELDALGFTRSSGSSSKVTVVGSSSSSNQHSEQQQQQQQQASEAGQQ
jgi:hypothetical protein